MTFSGQKGGKSVFGIFLLGCIVGSGNLEQAGTLKHPFSLTKTGEETITPFLSDLGA
jgi:hypothetical protein